MDELFLSTHFFYNQSFICQRTSIVTVTNEDNNNSTYYLMVDSSDDYHQTLKSIYKDTYQNEQKISREIIDYKTFMTEGGGILEKRNQYEVIRILSDYFNEEQGGEIVLDTLYNGSIGNRKSYKLLMTKNSNRWVLMNQGKILKKIIVQNNKIIFLGLVGIKNLIMESSRLLKQKQ